MNISNPIVANAMQSHVAKNMITSRQYKEIYNFLDSAYGAAMHIDDCIKGIAISLEDIRRCGKHITGAYDDEADKDARKIEKEVADSYSALKNLSMHKRLLCAAIDTIQKKYSTYDQKRLID